MHRRNDNKTGQENRAQTLTARDVAKLLRPQQQQQQTQCYRTASLSECVGHAFRNTIHHNNKKGLSRSVENLVLNAAPIGESSTISLNGLDDRNTSVI